MYHYMSLRKIVELVEALPQLVLQTYIGVRLWNPWGMFPPVQGASVNPWMLLISVAFSAMSVHDAQSFVQKFAKRQTGGDKGAMKWSVLCSLHVCLYL